MPEQAEMEAARLAAERSASRMSTSDAQAAALDAFGISTEAEDETDASNEQVVVDTLNTLGNPAYTEAPQITEQVVEQEPAPEPEFSIDRELPEDIQLDLDTEDELDLPELEAEEEPEQYEDDEYADEAVLAERKKRVALEKKLAYVQNQKLKADRKTWVERDAEYFPLADAKGIAERASSRREFRRLAKAEHERLKPFFLAQVKAREDALREAHQQKQAQAWGKPMTGPSVPTEATEYVENIEKARRTGSLRETIKARMLGGGNF